MAEVGAVGVKAEAVAIRRKRMVRRRFMVAVCYGEGTQGARDKQGKAGRGARWFREVIILEGKDAIMVGEIRYQHENKRSIAY